MKTIYALAISLLIAAAVTATSAGATYTYRACTAKQPAHRELACATHNLYHAQYTLQWVEQRSREIKARRGIQAQRDLLAFDFPLASTQDRLAQMRRDMRWLAGESRRDIAEAHRRLRAVVASIWPPHHALWMCIHGDPAYGSHYGNEATSWSDRDSGKNGHYGGLQMHPYWGYGTSHYASDDSQLTQEWAAEKGYRASGYSHFWLGGQWGETIGPCWRYA